MVLIFQYFRNKGKSEVVRCILLAKFTHIQDITHLLKNRVPLDEVVCEILVFIRVRSVCAGMRLTLIFVHI